jgi:hypothetical protein
MRLAMETTPVRATHMSVGKLAPVSISRISEAVAPAI